MPHFRGDFRATKSVGAVAVDRLFGTHSVSVRFAWRRLTRSDSDGDAKVRPRTVHHLAQVTGVSHIGAPGYSGLPIVSA
jgi:hypothetical protein